MVLLQRKIASRTWNSLIDHNDILCHFPIAGLMTKFEAMNFPQNQSLFGIRFFSDTVRHFFKFPISKFRKF
ncbi:DUF6597 domain-containing transcriptional factor [Bacillus sp. FSL K6-3431]|uniref:DUF6597 domain-containing transcriptional factor n=1 Tax=Bacillus sp. FSL K6-3431 TaxID=2921500 RepID=UPI004046E547